MRNFLSNLFIVVGSIFVVVSLLLFVQSHNPKRLEFAGYIQPTITEVQIATSSAGPKRLIMPDIGVDLPIIPAEKTEDKWPTTTKGISYLNSSPIPGEQGNSILYGHNWASILGDLKNSNTGQKIFVEYSDGSTKEFEIASIQRVGPNQTDILDQTKDNRITLYTCIGFLDRERLVVTAIAN